MDEILGQSTQQGTHVRDPVGGRPGCCVYPVILGGGGGGGGTSWVLCVPGDPGGGGGGGHILGAVCTR